MVLEDGSHRSGKEFGQGVAHPAKTEPRGGSNLAAKNAHFAIGCLRDDPQKRPATAIGPALGLLDGRDVNLVSARFRRERNKKLKRDRLAGWYIVRDRGPGAFQNEEVRFRIEELPTQREILGSPSLA